VIAATVKVGRCAEIRSRSGDAVAAGDAPLGERARQGIGGASDLVPGE
jgi:hypothetical protein